MCSDDVVEFYSRTTLCSCSNDDIVGIGERQNDDMRSLPSPQTDLFSVLVFILSTLLLSYCSLHLIINEPLKITERYIDLDVLK